MLRRSSNLVLQMGLLVLSWDSCFFSGDGSAIDHEANMIGERWDSANVHVWESATSLATKLVSTTGQSSIFLLDPLNWMCEIEEHRKQP